MCECSQSPPKTVSKLTFDSKMTKNEIERPQMGGGFLVVVVVVQIFLGTPQTCLNAGFAGPLRLRPADAGHYRPAASGRLRRNNSLGLIE